MPSPAAVATAVGVALGAVFLFINYLLSQEQGEAPYESQRKSSRRSTRSNLRRGWMAQDDTSCVICTDEFLPSTPRSPLHCGHVFHLHCIEHWKTQAPAQQCPICRAKI